MTIFKIIQYASVVSVDTGLGYVAVPTRDVWTHITKDFAIRMATPGVIEVRVGPEPKVRNCPSSHLAPGEFSGGAQMPCVGVKGLDGLVKDGCGEPCSFVMDP
jgi:hypothetical protein